MATAASEMAERDAIREEEAATGRRAKPAAAKRAAHRAARRRLAHDVVYGREEDAAEDAAPSRRAPSPAAAPRSSRGGGDRLTNGLTRLIVAGGLGLLVMQVISQLTGQYFKFDSKELLQLGPQAKPSYVPLTAGSPPPRAAGRSESV